MMNISTIIMLILFIYFPYYEFSFLTVNTIHPFIITEYCQITLGEDSSYILVTVRCIVEFQFSVHTTTEHFLFQLNPNVDKDYNLAFSERKFQPS
jgi:hypothetical protein